MTDVHEDLSREEPLCWYQAKTLTVEGQGWHDTEEVFDRLPLAAKAIVQPHIWALSKHTAGISIHFTTNSPMLRVKWDGFEAMNHMTALGVSGVDLYVRHQGQWRWLAVGRPTGAENQAELFHDLPSEPREFMLYLPLYHQVTQVELGIPDAFQLSATPIRHQKPVVFYGTSITQGGCASRPGMCYSAILGRWLDQPVINLGFSGYGVMEPEEIDLLCELDPAVFVLDGVPNMSVPLIKARVEKTVRTIRAAHPNTPIVLVDGLPKSNNFLVRAAREKYEQMNIAQYAIYARLIQAGVEQLFYIKDEGLIGVDGESTVDGCHLTDVGFLRFSEQVLPLLQAILKQAPERSFSS